MTKKQKLIFFAIVLLAIFFRFYKITQMPGGLFPDEAANGLDINSMQQGHLQPFYERGNGREALFFYMEWGSVAMFGKTPWAFHVTSAFMGLLAVIMCYFVTYRLMLMGEDGDDFKVRKKATYIGLLAMYLMAVSSWHVVLSRTAFRATLIPLFSALVIYFLLRAYQAVTNKSRIWFAVLCGISFALGFYTYIAFRIMAPILFMILLWPLLAQIKEREFGQTIKNYKYLILGFALAFVIVIFPIAKYFYQHPGSFVGRAGQVSVFNPGLYTVNGEQLHGKPPVSVVLPVIAQVFKPQVLGLFTQGDLNGLQNISGFPYLSPLVSPFFGGGMHIVIYFGLAYFFSPLKRAGWWKYFVLTGWFFGMLLPVVTTAEGIPHGLRGIGVIPVIFIVSAWALYEFSTWIYGLHKRIWERCWCHPRTSEWESAQKNAQLHHESHPHFNRFKFIGRCLKSVVAFFCLALILQTYFLYFVYAYNSAENFYAFRSDLTVVSNYLKSRCDKNHTYLILDTYWLQTTDYLTSDRYGNFSDPCSVPYQKVDPASAWQLTVFHPVDEVFFNQSTTFYTIKLKGAHREAHLKLEVRDKFGEVEMAVYGVN